MNNLALVTTTPATTATAKRATFRNAQTRTIQQLAAIWNAMSGTDKSTWKQLSGQMTHTNQKGMPSKVSPFATFTQVNTMLLGAGNDITTVAPTTPTAPAPLPNLSLSAALTALSVHATAAYAQSVIVYAAAPLLVGTNNYPDSAFKRIGHLGSLAHGPSDITALYMAHYTIPSAGYEIAIKIIGVMDSGSCTPATLVTAVVTA